MKYYIDITLLPDAEANLGFLWQKVYQQIHIALAEKKIAKNESAIAVSFPRYGDRVFPLGDKLRLLANQQTQLEQLNVAMWLNRLTDYTHATSIKEVPLSVEQFAYVKRKQFDTNVKRLAHRRAKRKGETFEQALKHLNQFKDKESSLPYINMKSLSGEKQFRFFIHQEVVEQSTTGIFNCYGLSRQEEGRSPTTVPWF